MTMLKKNLKKFEHLSEYLPENLPELPQLDFSAERFLEEPDYSEHRSFFVAIDILSPILVEELMSKVNEDSILIFWYLDATSLQLALESIDFAKLENKGAILCGHPSNQKQLEKTEEILNSLAFYMVNVKPILKQSNNVDFIRSCRELIAYLRDWESEFKLIIGNDLDDTLLGVKNNIINFPDLLKSAMLGDFLTEAKQYYQGKPAVIVATGPSLNKNIDLLAEYQDKALILACDASLEPLRKHSIKSDLVGTVERGLKTYQKFYEGKNLENEVFFGPAIVRPELIAEFPERRILCFKENGAYYEMFNKFTDGASEGVYGASVAHILLHLAHKLECDPIILVGQDFAYAKDGTSHAESSEVSEDIDIQDANLFIEGIDGEMLATSPIWKMFLTVSENMIEKYDIDNVIDATEGGAKIKGTEIMTLKEALGDYPKLEKPEMLNLVQTLIRSSEETAKFKEQSLQELQELLMMFSKLNDDIQIALKDNKKATNRVEKGVKTQNQLDKIYDALDYTVDNVVEVIRKSDELLLYYQYFLRLFYMQISQIETAEFSVDTIKQNLEVQKNFLDKLELYNMKMLRLIVEGMDYLIEKFDIQDYDDSEFKKYRHYSNDDDLIIKAV